MDHVLIALLITILVSLILTSLLVTRAVRRKRRRRDIREARQKLQRIKMASRSPHPSVRRQVRWLADQLSSAVEAAGLTLVEIGTSRRGLNKFVHLAEDYSAALGSDGPTGHSNPEDWRFGGNVIALDSPELLALPEPPTRPLMETDFDLEVEVELPPEIRAHEAWTEEILAAIEAATAETDEEEVILKTEPLAVAATIFKGGSGNN